MMKLYQTAIFTAVVFADIYFEWNAQGYAIIAVAAFAAYSLTVWPIKFYDLFMKLQARIEEVPAGPSPG